MKRAIVVLVALMSTGAGRCATKPVPTTRGPEQPRASAAAGPSAAPPAKEEACAAGGPAAVILGRVAIGAGGAPAAWYDVEVRGAANDAKRVCDALLRREAEMVYPKETHLAARVVRPCSGDAMAEPDTNAAWLLVDRRELGEADLILASSACPPDARRPMAATSRRLSAFTDKKACEDALTKVVAGGDAGDAQARESAHQWLDGAIGDQEKRVADACKGAKDAKESEACRRAESVLRVLKEKRTAPDEPVKRPGVTQICRAR